MNKKILIFSLTLFLVSAGILFFADSVFADASVNCTCSGSGSGSGCAAPLNPAGPITVEGSSITLEALRTGCQTYCQSTVSPSTAIHTSCAFTIDESSATGDLATGILRTVEPPASSGICCNAGTAVVAGVDENTCRLADGTWMEGLTSCTTPPPSGSTGGTTKSESIKSISLPNPLGTTDIRVIIGNIIKAVMGIIGSIALALFMWGGFLWMTAAGEASRVKKGQQTIIAATIGLAVIFLSYTLVNFVLSSLTSLGEETEEVD